jgi:hypothetical protein
MSNERIEIKFDVGLFRRKTETLVIDMNDLLTVEQKRDLHADLARMAEARSRAEAASHGIPMA